MAALTKPPDGVLNNSLGFAAENGRMAKAIALVRSQRADNRIVDLARALIVGGCGLALVLAGPVLPF